MELRDKYNSEDLVVEDMEQAQEWIRVMHRRTVQDAERMNKIEDRLRKLERPWYRRVFR